ncbi:hypothetical protein F4553_005389 [Allocatelliglobosispora scoriae]|uniref:Tyr recombinase domain-containing protein n=1 Tax=Allocatelliglobosispora scoriae TaxID=643052 RepID=A0A841BZ62_9ACTN|nr:integrase [Allocatelliglobosispora scoriae]MBB5872010.1 hypothetical protein [Allocatelliglobosispora scoriae]
MDTTYDVRLYALDIYQGKRVTTYWVVWRVAGRRWKEPFRDEPMATRFLADLTSAVSRGEAFDVETGRPVSMARKAVSSVTWYSAACTYADSKWQRSAATTRRTRAEALSALTLAMLADSRGRPDEAMLRHTLQRYAFNPSRRHHPDRPPEVAAALAWLETHTRKVSALAKPDVLRSVLDSLTVRLDGTPRASSVVSRWRKILNAFLENAVERKLLPTNPLPALKWSVPKTSHTVDRRSVANPLQARTLLVGVSQIQRSGPRLVAFFACLYFAALRPEEAANLAKHHLSLPAEGWGELHLSGAAPHAGKDWTDTGTHRERRQLKQRAVGESRTVPCPPELTAYLHWHIEQFGTAPDGRLFRGERNEDELPKGTVNRYWRLARKAVLAPDAYASP